MFDSLLGKRFTSKCKQAIKCIGMRVPPIRGKNQARVKFLCKDVADLISNGLDINAFGRIDSLFVEMNKVACYDIINQYCEYIKIQLPALQRQRECPPESMEAVGSLIYAAARFPDLPELCDLRRLFTERYGDHVESCVNAEFVEKIQKTSFSMDKKLHLMQGIAQDYSVTWDCKAFQQNMPNLAASVMNQSKKGICHQINESRSTKMNKGIDNDMQNEDIPYIEHFEATPRIISSKQVQPEPRDIHVVSCINSGADNARKFIATEQENDELNENTKRNVDNKAPWEKEEHGLIGLAKEAVGANNAASMVPSSTKLNANKISKAQEEPQERQPVPVANSGTKRSLSLIPPPYYVKPKASNPLANARHIDDEQKDQLKNQISGIEKPKPVSVRRRSVKVQAATEIASSTDDVKLASEIPSVRRTPSDRRGNATRKTGGTNYDGDFIEDEERVMDQLLVHYSKKGVEHQSNGKVHPEEKNPLHTRRATSFPVEPITPSKVVKGPARAASLQPEILSPGGGSVHPRLPNCDDFEARFRALKKN